MKRAKQSPAYNHQVDQWQQRQSKQQQPFCPIVFVLLLPLLLLLLGLPLGLVQAAAHPVLKNYNPTPPAERYLLLSRGLDQFAKPFVKANCHLGTPVP
ncbi:hypothetical protein AWZ03_003658 [Drosophila navojoa]|uniref:Uncharacterized protein n=1 Tax=Drosophila navojoa TaxID=7232 RepID=A0A484BNV3_DRONA|nr:hypothetical protein AWZ03_003658 [Drosophila navojoa]